MDESAYIHVAAVYNDVSLESEMLALRIFAVYKYKQCEPVFDILHESCRMSRALACLVIAVKMVETFSLDLGVLCSLFVWNYEDFWRGIQNLQSSELVVLEALDWDVALNIAESTRDVASKEERKRKFSEI